MFLSIALTETNEYDDSDQIKCNVNLIKIELK